MKTFIITSVLLSLSSFAAPVKNTRTGDKVVVSRVQKVVNLVDKEDIKVNITLVDIGGSQDFSPTKEVFFSLYSKGELFSTDATFSLGQVFELKSSRRLSGGIYEVKFLDENNRDKTLRIDAISAIKKIKNVTCESVDCSASDKFSTTIDVSSK